MTRLDVILAEEPKGRRRILLGLNIRLDPSLALRMTQSSIGKLLGYAKISFEGRSGGTRGTEASVIFSRQETNATPTLSVRKRPKVSFR